MSYINNKINIPDKIIVLHALQLNNCKELNNSYKIAMIWLRARPLKRG